MFRSLLAVALLCAASSAWAGTIINLEEAAEIEKLEILTQGTSAGVIYGRICDACELLRLSVDAGTTITRQRTFISLDQAAALRGQGATVLFDPATRKVTRIIFWN